MGSEMTTQETQVVAVTPMQMIDRAMASGATVETLTKLMDLQERWEKNEARKAFHEAFSAFKAEAVEVIKSTAITAGPLNGRKYADLATAVDAATPKLSQHGLSAAWKVTKDEKEWIEVTCSLTHVMGHSESVSFGGPPDTGGAKNAIQARASSMNYLQRYTFLAVCGLAAKNADDDGAGGKEEKETMPAGQKADFFAAIEAAVNKEGLDALWPKILEATPSDANARDELRSAMLTRKKALK